MTVTPEDRPFEPEARNVAPMPDPPPEDPLQPAIPIDQTLRRLRILLRPTPAYPFPDRATVLHGRLQETAAANAPRVAGVMVEPQWKDLGANWNASVATEVTTANGEFRAALLLPPGAQADGGPQQITTRVVFTRGALRRASPEALVTPGTSWSRRAAYRRPRAPRISACWPGINSRRHDGEGQEGPMADPNQPQESATQPGATPTPPASPPAGGATPAASAPPPGGGRRTAATARHSHGIDEQLAELERETAKQKLLESLKTELAPIKQKKDQAIKNYTDKKREDLLARWKAQATALERNWKDINDYPNWSALIDRVVCPIKDKIKRQAETVSALAPPQGTKQKKVAEAKAKVDARKAELDGWLSIDQQLSKQLDDVDKAIKEVKDAYNGPEPVISLYLFWFKALPLHQSITPNAAGASREPAIAVEKWPACLKWPERGNIYLIATADLPRKIDAAWQEYRKARDDLAQAESDFNKQPDDLATEMRTLDQLKKNEDQDIRDALKRDQAKSAPNPRPAQAAPLRDRDGDEPCPNICTPASTSKRSSAARGRSRASPTSTAAFLGETERGPIKPRLVTELQRLSCAGSAACSRATSSCRTPSTAFRERRQARLHLPDHGPTGRTRDERLRRPYRHARSAPGNWGNRVFVHIKESTTKVPRPGQSSQLDPVGYPHAAPLTGASYRRDSCHSIRSTRPTSCRGRRSRRTSMIFRWPTSSNDFVEKRINHNSALIEVDLAAAQPPRCSRPSGLPNSPTETSWQCAGQSPISSATVPTRCCEPQASRPL